MMAESQIMRMADVTPRLVNSPTGHLNAESSTTSTGQSLSDAVPPVDRTVRSANGSLSRVLSEGSVTLPNGLRIPDAQQVAGFSVNLLSLGQLVRDGWTITQHFSHDHHWLILDDPRGEAQLMTTGYGIQVR